MLDLKDPMHFLPDIHGFTVKQIDSHALEVEVKRGTDINTLFTQLSERNIYITSMRNKANRLEELFVKLLNENAA